MLTFYKICLSRYLITLGLLYQAFVIITTRTAQISPIAFVIMGLGAFFTFYSETAGQQRDSIGISRIINVILFFIIATFSAFKYRK